MKLRTVRGTLMVTVMMGGLFAQLAAAQTASAPFAADEFMRVTDPALATGINFSKAFKADFNNDGILDKVVCSNTDHSVKVYDGKKLNSVLYEWAGPATNTIATDPTKPKVLSNRVYTGCTVAELTSGRPSIILSDSYVHPVLGFRIPVEQYVLLNEGLDAAGAIKMVVRQVRKADNTTYRAPVRSIKCTPYPEQLVQAGKNPGILCFYAGYDQGWPDGYGDRVALLKFEDNNGTLVTKDLTASAGLPWTGGMNGTPMSTFRTYKNASGATKSDGLSMMGGAWLDFNKDGLFDLVTVGQHSSIWAFKMAVNTAKPEGISFSKTDIMTASNVSMTEFLTVSALAEQDPRIKLPCVYITGEVSQLGSPTSYDTPDHIRCYQNGSWVTQSIPGAKAYSSAMAGASIKIDASGRILALAPNFHYDSTGALLPETPATNLFEINPSDTCSVKLESQVLAADKTTLVKTMSQIVSVAKGSTPQIGGWVDCNSTSRNAYFTGVTYTSGTSNITQLGWWTQSDFLAHQSSFQSFPYQSSGSFQAVAGTARAVTLWNGCSKVTSKIIATVLSCTNNVAVPGAPTAAALPDSSDQSGQVLGVETVAPSMIGTVLSQIQDVLSQISALLTK